MVRAFQTVPTQQDRVAAIRRGFWLEWLSIAWMTIEAIAAASAGVAVGSLTLTAFGLDSVIELLSAGVLIGRLAVELRQGQEFSERTEHLASLMSAGLLFALAAYIVIGAAWRTAHSRRNGVSRAFGDMSNPLAPVSGNISFQPATFCIGAPFGEGPVLAILAMLARAPVVPSIELDFAQNPKPGAIRVKSGPASLPSQVDTKRSTIFFELESGFRDAAGSMTVSCSGL